MSKFYVATAIPYANAKPHIGNAMDFLYADILARYQRQQGNDVLFSTGADEHGMKIAEKAEAEGIAPQQLVDTLAPVWQDFITKAGISNDLFIRTTNPEHKKRVAIIWKNLEKYIYKGAYKGWYCVGCEEYKTDSHVKETDGVCPVHERKYDELQEENYFLKLSAFNERLQEAVKSDLLQVIPSSRKNEIMQVFKEGLDDISISRPSEKLSWGVPVPGDTTQTMYVWFEAVCNYITVLGYPDHQNFKDYWPANVQIIGKDILRFHAAIWPAMLMGLELPLLEKLYVHGHVSSNGKKMSKTLGNVIDPQEVIEKYGLDPFRYYFARHISSYEDGDFSWEKYENVYNAELANELGNAVSRVSAMVKKYQDGVIGNIPESEHDTTRYHEALAIFRFDKALEVVWEQVRGLNQFIEEEKPWQIAKENDPEHLQEVLANMCSDLLEIAELLEPFMPTTSAKIQAVFAEGIIRELDGPLFPRAE
jgi:methionyl-tRNA synthetase